MIIIMCFLSYKSFSQELFFSQEEGFNYRSEVFEVVGKCDDRIYAYRTSKEGEYLDAFNDSMKKTATIHLDFIPTNNLSTKIIAIGNRIMVLYQVIEKNKAFAYGAILDSKGLLISKAQVLDSAMISWYERKNGIFFYLKHSSDKSKVLIYRINNQTDFVSKLYDTQWQLLEEHESDLYFDKTEGVLKDVVVHQDGTTFLLLSDDKGRRNIATGAALITLPVNGSAYKQTIIPLGFKHFSGLRIKTDQSNKFVYFSALYTDKRGGIVQGIISGKFHPEQLYSNSTIHLHPFDPTMRSTISNKSRRKTFNDYELKDIIIREDGGYLVLAEHHYVSTRNFHGQTMGFYSKSYDMHYNSNLREYFYGDILVVSYDANGSKEWHNFIRKEQTTQEDGGLFSAFSYLNTGNNLVFIFNNFSFGKATVTLVAIDDKGELQMKRLPTAGMPAVDWIPRASLQIEAMEIITPYYKRNKLGFVKLSF